MDLRRFFGGPCSCPCWSSLRPVLDYKTGFGGKFGVQEDRKDKSAFGWDHLEKVDKHESQRGRLKSLPLSEV